MDFFRVGNSMRSEIFINFCLFHHRILSTIDHQFREMGNEYSVV